MKNLELTFFVVFTLAIRTLSIYIVGNYALENIFPELSYVECFFIGILASLLRPLPTDNLAHSIEEKNEIVSNAFALSIFELILVGGLVAILAL